MSSWRGPRIAGNAAQELDRIAVDATERKLGAGVAAAELGEAQPGEPGVASLDELWQLLIRAAVLWYAAFAVWILLL